ncbi:probable glycosyltransferase At3g07620 [Lotus japonicus]|uniref:probable glycosyltransferase At3g07620 n=1 Tax=Lotus japonicus TaxID=34305 RepID=UPI002582D00E|nr:probable glycosyltransferase At3g07620 [Lotus japonicus]XP_057423859.1 probable glycosyltransferase At3g07620 [Lotus japonicus]XP_057423861.1 probable glycosyltransferase At3g07620 [Lotus japonicus]XP_057423862.1 probable glycosyltransferase At3g07620 [Lotus japonicus]XP_057423863.1 probable glycosyltransferase At3g07620 [Lotus japonicus]XP_057423864.1 probable glycosyltransferase At3g07620 [Lotus japonicus]XP_057423865.1 probable glycosyltransferase At3g07620 [Lotus japonicus]XP_05742386
MGQDFFNLFHLETKRLLWLIGITFAVIISFQYLELPYGNVLLSLFSADKVSTSHTTAPSPELGIVSNATIFNEANSTDEHDLSRINMSATSTGFVLEQGSPPNNSIVFDESDKSRNNITTNGSREENITSRPENKSASSYAYSPEKAPVYLTPVTNVSTSIITPVVLSNENNISLSQNESTNSTKEGSFRPSTNDDKIPSENSSINIVPQEKGHSPVPVPEVTSVSEMTKLLLQSHVSYRSMRPRWFSAVDQELLQARLEIENAPIIRNDPNLYAPIYQNVSMFKRSYELMEERLKVYVYREGDRPILHSPFLTGIYASEGWFMKLMEANKRFVTNDPNKAHLFYLPFSSRLLEETLYVKDSHSRDNLVQYLHDYVDLIAGKHPFWNRTGGADHFLVGCHDWAPAETRERLANCIRALCNADVKEGFVFGKDASLPETNVHNALNPTRDVGGYPASKKKTLAFFAGKMHGYVRPILLQHWENKDPDMKISGKLPRSKGNKNYIQYMKSSKYCICARGYEVNSPRVVEAIFYECVPVIISDNFVPPFFEVLNWESFAVIILEKDIPNLKNILLSIPKKRYLRLLMRVKKVQQHFLWHKNPVKYDMFHMILHSIWYNRVFSSTAR